MKNITPRRQRSLGQLTSLAAAAALFLALPVAATAGEQQSVADKLPINIQQTCPTIAGLAADSKEVMEFTHALHAEKYLKGKSAFSAIPYSDDFTCAACHLGAKTVADISGKDKCERLAESLEAGGGAAEYKKQMHAICMDCHKNMAKANEATGPVKCGDCHGK
ncbi:MAG: cytochrome c3 family protein [Thermodesulfobacteriota bacterium]